MASASPARGQRQTPAGPAKTRRSGLVSVTSSQGCVYTAPSLLPRKASARGAATPLSNGLSSPRARPKRQTLSPHGGATPSAPAYPLWYSSSRSAMSLCT